MLRCISEKKDITFTEILNVSTHSPSLSCRLRSLTLFMEQENGKHRLTPLGKDAYNPLLRTATYNRMALSHRNKCEVTLGNSFIWAAAIFSAAILGADVALYGVMLPILTAAGLSMIYELLE